MTLLQRIQDHRAVIGVIGLGYVGTPLTLRFAKQGFQVLGFDIDSGRVSSINRGESPVGHIPDAEIASILAAGFQATDDFERIAEVDAIIVCVPTPMSAHREPDMSYVMGTVEAALPHLRSGQVLSLESTVWPGATEELIAPLIKEAGFAVGTDFHLIFSPEREDPGNADYDLETIPKLVGGVTPACLKVGEALYGAIVDQVVPVSGPRVAEMAKLLENIYRAVNIGLVNELKIVAESMDLDIYEIIDAAATKPFGFKAFYPGPGVGGHCIPIDPFYLTWKARELGVHTRFIELAGDVNAAMPGRVVEQISRALNRVEKSVKGAKILVLGIAYKPDIGDPRESPSMVVMEELRELGADLRYSDPHVERFPDMRAHNFDLVSTPITPEILAEQDAVVLLTDHTRFNYAMIAEHAPLIVDTRGRFRGLGGNVVTA